VLNEYFSQNEIKITKKTKRSIREIDVKPLLNWESSVITLPAGNMLNINPWNVLENIPCDILNVCRLEILCDDGGVFE
jgi:hypothetical protein